MLDLSMVLNSIHSIAPSRFYRYSTRCQVTKQSCSQDANMSSVYVWLEFFKIPKVVEKHTLMIIRNDTNAVNYCSNLHCSTTNILFINKWYAYSLCCANFYDILKTIS